MKAGKTLVGVEAHLYQPDQPGSDQPNFVYEKDKVQILLLMQYDDGSGKQLIIDEENI